MASKAEDRGSIPLGCANIGVIKMRKLGGREAILLKKYLKGQLLDLQDRCLAKELESIGLLHIGFSIRNKQNTAKTTNLGFRGL